MNKTDIEYLDYTWNPLAMRCPRTESPGCLNCWYHTMAARARSAARGSNVGAGLEQGLDITGLVRL